MRAVKYALMSTVIAMVALIIVAKAFIGRNDMYTWQYVQKWNGHTFVQNEFGWYWKGLASVTTYPDVLEVYGTKKPCPQSPGDDSARVNFNDGGWADVDWYARIRLPKPTFEEGETAEMRAAIEQKQQAFHRMFRSAPNAIAAVRAHARDCIGKTGNIMSASENQAARKAEFFEVAFGQFKDGYYEMRPVTIRRKGLKDLIQAVEAASTAPQTAVQPAADDAPPKEEPKDAPMLAQATQEVVGESSIESSETVRAAEVVIGADGKPVIAIPSPLAVYDVQVLQFSLSETEYDGGETDPPTGTMAKFKEKRALLLATETARALAVQQAQERLMNIAEGNRAIAETEATANQEMARKVIAAQVLQEVDGVKKKLFEVQGATKVLVAEVMGKQLEAERETAVLEAQTAENARKAAEITAKAQEQMIALGGAATEAEKALQEIYTKQTQDVAEGLPTLQVPDTVIIAMDALPEGMSPMEAALPSLQFIRAAGLMEPLKEMVETKWTAGQVGEMPKIVLPPVTPNPDAAKPAAVTDAAAKPQASPPAEKPEVPKDAPKPEPAKEAAPAVTPAPAPKP